MERFRPNIVLKGNKSNAEHHWKVIIIGEQLELEQTFMAPRCSAINSLDGKVNTKAFNTMYKHAQYKDTSKNVYFGHACRKMSPSGRATSGAKVS